MIIFSNSFVKLLLHKAVSERECTFYPFTITYIQNPKPINTHEETSLIFHNVTRGTQTQYLLICYTTQKVTIHQVTTMLATSKISHFQVIITGTEDLTL